MLMRPGPSCQLLGNGSNGTPVSFANEGTLRATGAGFKSVNTSFAQTILTSTGAVAVDEGELRLNCQATLSTGATVAAGATLTNARTLVLDGALTGDGAFSHVGGTTTVNAGIAESLAVPVFSGGTVVVNAAIVRQIERSRR